MRRRDFITGIAGSAAAWPSAARAQQDGRVRLIGWMDSYDETSLASQSIRTALRAALAELGWIEGRNLKIDRRFGGADANRLRAIAAELVSLAPDVIVTPGAAPTRALQQATQTIPIIFTGGGDAAANGLVKNIARPESNTTGFSSAEPTIGGKWLELLKEAVPRLTRVAIVFNPEVAPTAPNYISSIQQAAQTLSMQTVKLAFRDTVELVRSIDAFATEPNGGLLMLPPPSIPDRATIIKLAAQHRLPAVYSQRALAAEGGLISYSADIVDQNRRAASYVDRILRGAKVSELPVQFPTKYELVVNVNTAKAIGLTMPEAFLLHADELIE
jgi:putative ABC transport system substrate-binding protein